MRLVKVWCFWFVLKILFLTKIVLDAANMEGRACERNSSDVSRSTSSSVHSSQKRASSYRVASVNPKTQSNSRRQCDRYQRDECGLQMASTEEKSVLPISVNNSPRQQISDTSTQVFSLNRCFLRGLYPATISFKDLSFFLTQSY